MNILCYTWLKIAKPNDMSTSVVGCYIPHQDFDFFCCLDKQQMFANQEDHILISNTDFDFFCCLDKHQMFANLEDHITYFIHKGGIIVFGDMNAHT